MRQLVAIIVLCMLSACSTLSWSGLWSLRSLDPSDIDPAVAHVAVGFSDQVSIEAVEIKMTLGTEERERVVEFDMLPIEDEVQRRLVPFHDRVEALYVYRVPPDQHADVRAFQAAVKRRDAAGGDEEGSLSIDVQFGDGSWGSGKACTARLDKLRLNSAVLVDADQGYIELNKGNRLTRILEGLKASICSPSATLTS